MDRGSQGATPHLAPFELLARMIAQTLRRSVETASGFVDTDREAHKASDMAEGKKRRWRCSQPLRSSGSSPDGVHTCGFSMRSRTSISGTLFRRSSSFTVEPSTFKARTPPGSHTTSAYGSIAVQIPAQEAPTYERTTARSITSSVTVPTRSGAPARSRSSGRARSAMAGNQGAPRSDGDW